MRRRLTEIRSTAGREEGFTVFEMLVASLLLLIGMMATLQAFDAAGRNTLRLKQSQVILDRAQQEMEMIRALPYSQIALTVLPSHSSDADSPGARISGGQFDIGLDPAIPTYAELVYNGASLYGGGTVSGGAVAPESGTVTSGDLKFRVYRYVVWQRDSNCPNSAPAGQVSCPGNQDFKRVIVAVRLVDGGGGFSSRPYLEIQSDFIDPSKSALTDPPAGPQGVVSAQQFWLSDTPCASSGETLRAEVNADHPLHNTLGVCSNGLKTGGTAGAPDALLPSSPPDPFLDDPTLPGFFDFANDFYLEPSPPDGDRGVQIRRQDASGCSYTPGGSNPESKIHRWVTDTMPAQFTATGQATLEFYTAAINNALHSGRLCIYLFRRNGSSDTLINNSSGGLSYFTYEPPAGQNWPRATPTASDPLGWAKVRVVMNFSQFNVPAGDRLGIALSTERSGTTFDAGLQFLYDHHLTPSRVEFKTTTPLDLINLPQFQITNPTVTALPGSLSGQLANFKSGETVTYRLDNASTGTILTATTTPSTIGAAGTASVSSLAIPAGTANGAHTVYAIGSQGSLAGRTIDVSGPEVTATTIATTTGCSGGYLKRSAGYYVYANATGSPASVTANVSNITAGQTAVAMTAGSWTINGVAYNYRSSLLTSSSTLAEGTASFTATPAGGAAKAGSVIADATQPRAIDVQTANSTGGVLNKANTGDTLVYTYSEPIDPCSIVAGWTGVNSTPVTVRFIDAGGSKDKLEVWNSANTALLPLGQVNLGPAKGDYVPGGGAVFSSSTLQVNTYQFILTLGTLTAGGVRSPGGNDVMTWTPSASAWDIATNANTTTVALESGVADKEF